MAAALYVGTKMIKCKNDKFDEFPFSDFRPKPKMRKKQFKKKGKNVKKGEKVKKQPKRNRTNPNVCFGKRPVTRLPHSPTSLLWSLIPKAEGGPFSPAPGTQLVTVSNLAKIFMSYW